MFRAFACGGFCAALSGGCGGDDGPAQAHDAGPKATAWPDGSDFEDSSTTGNGSTTGPGSGIGTTGSDGVTVGADGGADSDGAGATRTDGGLSIEDAGTHTAGGSGDSGSAPDLSHLPKPKGVCPKLVDGSLSIAGSTVKLWVGSKPGPVIFYFHGTGSIPDEVQLGVPNATTNVKTNGGIVASWETSSGTGTSTGGPWAVWYTGDYDAADEILACGIEQQLVDTSHIHVAGYSAGGLQTGAMIFDRSNYIASAIVYSGGRLLGGTFPADYDHIPSVVFAHGAPGSDQFIVDFAKMSTQLEGTLRQYGGFVIDCNDGGSHVDLGRLGINGKATEFFQNHPFGSPPDSSLSGWPSYCSIVK